MKEFYTNLTPLLETFLALLRRKWLIIINTILGTLLMYGVAWLLPVWWQAESITYPPYNSSSGMSTLSSIGGMLGVGSVGGDFALPIMKTQADLWAAIVKTPTVIDTLIVNENLMARYEVESMGAAREEFSEHISVDVTGEGMLKIAVEDQEPKYAAYLTNLIVERLNRVISEVKVSSSKETKLFLEQRLADTRTQLENFEDSLVQFQTEHGAISVEDQARVIIENASQLKGEQMIVDVELGIAQKTYGTNHNKVQTLLTRKNELSRKIKELEYGSKKDKNMLDIPLANVPQLSMDYARLVRETTSREILYTFLVQQYEQAVIEEKRDMPTIKILAKAIPPEKKSRPMRSVLAVIAGFLIFVFTCTYVIVTARINQMQDTAPEQFKLIEEIKANLFFKK